jgi:hypothetical protein
MLEELTGRGIVFKKDLDRNYNCGKLLFHLILTNENGKIEGYNSYEARWVTSSVNGILIPEESLEIREQDGGVEKSRHYKFTYDSEIGLYIGTVMGASPVGGSICELVSEGDPLKYDWDQIKKAKMGDILSSKRWEIIVPNLRQRILSRKKFRKTY